MINIQDVLEIVSTLGGYDDSDTQRYVSVIENAVLSVENMLKDESYSGDKRIIFLAGIKACRDISVLSGSAAGITSFKVGDISITENSESGGSFDILLNSSIENCSQMLSDGGAGFAFMDV